MTDTGNRGFLNHVDFGVIAGVYSRALIDEVIFETGTGEKRVRLLPARVVVLYVIALGMFFGAAYEEVMARLIGGLRFLRSWSDSWQQPTSSSLSKARRRLGVAPMKLLFERACAPIADPGTDGAWYQGLRIMAIDGLMVEMPDTEANNEVYTHTRTGSAPGAFPVLRAMALCESGTHAIVGVALGSTETAETVLAPDLMPFVEPGMLVLADRGLAGKDLFERLTNTETGAGAHTLMRVSGGYRLDSIEELPDGSHLSVLLPQRTQGQVRRTAAARGGAGTPAGRAYLEAAGTVCRVITYTVTHSDPDTATDAADTGGGSETDSPPQVIRLITSMLDPDQAPALELAALYQQRWEIELTFREIQSDVTGNTRVLRSKSPDMVQQEFYGILLAHYATRTLMHQAATAQGLSPVRVSFLASIEILRRHVMSAADFSPSTQEAASDGGAG